MVQAEQRRLCRGRPAGINGGRNGPRGKPTALTRHRKNYALTRVKSAPADNGRGVPSKRQKEGYVQAESNKFNF